MRKILIVLSLMSATAATTSYGFGLPKIPGVGGGASASSGSSVSGDAVDKFIAVGAESTAAINEANKVLAFALTKKEDKAKLAQQIQEMDKGLASKDEKERKAAQAVQASLAATIAEQLSSGEAEQRLSELSIDQLEKVGKSVLYLGYGILVQKEQLPAGQNMITAISSNPMLATKLPAVKNTVTDMASNIKNVGGYLFKLPTLLKTAKVNITLPTDTSTKPEGIKLDDFMSSTNAN